jgi:hypothetical protein
MMTDNFSQEHFQSLHAYLETQPAPPVSRNLVEEGFIQVSKKYRQVARIKDIRDYGNNLTKFRYEIVCRNGGSNVETLTLSKEEFEEFIQQKRLFDFLEEKNG